MKDTIKAFLEDSTRVGAVCTKRLPDGSKETVIKPSKSGAVSGAAAGASVGGLVGGPVGAGVGAVVGGTIGFIFGPAD